MSEFTFFFDRCVGKKLPEALSRIKCPFEIRFHQQEGFKDDTTDDEWLHAIGPKKWIVLSYDAKWHSEQPAIQAIKQHKIGCFYLPGASSIGFLRLIRMARAYDRMKMIIGRDPKPFVYRISSNNRFTRII